MASPITIGGKELIVQGHPDTQPQYKSYYYGYGDVVFKLAYNGDNFDEQMAALASQLPYRHVPRVSASAQASQPGSSSISSRRSMRRSMPPSSARTRCMASDSPPKMG